jgi:hypothetical protein
MEVVGILFQPKSFIFPLTDALYKNGHRSSRPTFPLWSLTNQLRFFIVKT